MSSLNENNRGTLWKNERKVKGDKQPYFTGKVNVEGKEYDIAVWHYPATDTKKAMFPVRLSEPYVKPEGSNVNLGQIKDDDLPF